MGRVVTRALVLSVVAVMFVGAPVCADILVLTNGDLVEGKVIKQDRRTVTFKYRVGSIWTTKDFSRTQIDSIVVEQGDQSADAAKKDEPERVTGRIGGGSRSTGSSKQERPTGRNVSVIPLHGQVGGVVEDRLVGTFDAVLLERCFEQAKADGAELVVLDIESPGGLISEMERICEMIIKWHGDLRIVAFPREAYSAAAIITLTCRELAVRPDSQFGAAVHVRRDKDGMSALDAKMASPHHAKQRRYMAESGQPYDVVKAMTIQEVNLWWSAQRGFSTSVNRNDPSWDHLDDDTTVLTVTAAEALKWKLAKAEARNIEELLTALEIGGDIEIVSHAETIDEHLQAIDKEYVSFGENLEKYFMSIMDIRSGMIAAMDAARGNDRNAMRATAAEVNRQASRANAAGRALEKIDRRILQRRIDVPDEMIERIHADRKLLRSIPKLVRAGTAGGFNSAADRFNEVIGEWQRILGDDG